MKKRRRKSLSHYTASAYTPLPPSHKPRPIPANHPAARLIFSPTHPRSHPTRSSASSSPQLSTSASRPSRCAVHTAWQRSTRHACARAVAPAPRGPRLGAALPPPTHAWRTAASCGVGAQLPAGCWRWARWRIRVMRFLGASGLKGGCGYAAVETGDGCCVGGAVDDAECRGVGFWGGESRLIA